MKTLERPVVFQAMSEEEQHPPMFAAELMALAGQPACVRTGKEMRTIADRPVQKVGTRPTDNKSNDHGIDQKTKP